MSVNPAKRFGLPAGIVDGEVANLTVFNLNDEYEINPDNFLSKGKSTPFKGYKVKGKCLANFCNGKLLFNDINK